MLDLEAVSPPPTTEQVCCCPRECPPQPEEEHEASHLPRRLLNCGALGDSHDRRDAEPYYISSRNRASSECT